MVRPMKHVSFVLYFNVLFGSFKLFSLVCLSSFLIGSTSVHVKKTSEFMMYSHVFSFLNKIQIGE